MDLNEIFEFIVNNYGWVCLVMIALVCVILEAIKLPLKKLTALIKNDYLRKLVNKIFIVLSFGLAFLLYYLGNKLLPKYVEYEPLRCLITGAFSNVLYALSEGIITTSKAKRLTETIKEVTNDGKITTDEVVSTIKVVKDKSEKVETNTKSALEQWQDEMKNKK